MIRGYCLVGASITKVEARHEHTGATEIREIIEERS
jgi:hypothetical protein